MLLTYLFVPANKQRYIEKSGNLDVDEIIFDLEDAVASSELSLSIKNLENLENRSKYWVRPSLFKGAEINVFILQKLIDLGFQKFVLPKISRKDQLEFIEDWIYEEYGESILNKLEIILLVENPSCLMALDMILESRIGIKALSLGSHDYCDFMCMEHIKENMIYPKQRILNIARSKGIMFLDSASMNIENKEVYSEDIEEAFSIGSDGKILIHPNQLNWISSFQFYKEDEIRLAKKIWSEVEKIGEDKLNVIKVDGKVYEKPHIKRIKKIINWAKKHENQ